MDAAGDPVCAPVWGDAQIEVWAMRSVGLTGDVTQNTCKLASADPNVREGVWWAGKLGVWGAFTVCAGALKVCMVFALGAVTLPSITHR